DDPCEGVAAWAVQGIGQWSRLPNDVIEPLFRYVRRAPGADRSLAPMFPEQAHGPVGKPENPPAGGPARPGRAATGGHGGAGAAGGEGAGGRRGAEGRAPGGAGAAAAVPDLIDAVWRGQAVPAAVQALLRIGPAAVARLAELITAGERWQAILGPEVLPYLL